MAIISEFDLNLSSLRALSSSRQFFVKGSDGAVFTLEIKNEDVYFVGGMYNKYELEVVRSNAFSYFHGHSVGGTNPSLLEAMASRNICICHDNEFNKGVVSDSGFYFKTIQDISDIIKVIERNDYSHYGNAVFENVKNYFSWGNIVKLYADYFKEITK